MLHTLLLVPTQFELDHLSSSFLENLSDNFARLELVGFGPVVAGIRTSRLIEQLKPQQVILFGIAGDLREFAEVGTAAEFDQVACYGIGAGAGDGFETADEMGWLQWGRCLDDALAEPIGCNLRLARPHSVFDHSVSGSSQLLTCCSASSKPLEAEQKRSKFPNAIAEDMEGFSVAVACRFAQVPLRIVRGVSNVAGDRNRDRWKVEAAMQAAEIFVSRILST
jgi:futalosine hydrolase